MAENHIQRLIEVRNIESLKKKIPIKLTAIAKVLGQPIIEQLDNALEWSEEEILTFDETADTIHKGYTFSHLSAGVNLEITSLTYGEEDSTIKCYYEGKLVFHEEERELKAYVPNNDWEVKINELYEKALIAEKIEREQNKKIEREMIKKKGLRLVQKLKSLWGGLE